jgi:hypothetical protein
LVKQLEEEILQGKLTVTQGIHQLFPDFG